MKLDSAWLVFLCSFFIIFGFQHFATDVGLGNSGNANLYVQTAISKGNFPLISHEELNMAVGKADSGILLVDARDEVSFSYGSIPGAKNISVFFDDSELIEALKDVERTRKVVIYCQSSKCTYDEKLGIKIAGLGFDRIRLYKEGWSHWKQEKGD